MGKNTTTKNSNQKYIFSENNEIEFGIDVENSFEYYGTDDIDDIPIHLRKDAKKILKKQLEDLRTKK